MAENRFKNIRDVSGAKNELKKLERGFEGLKTGVRLAQEGMKTVVEQIVAKQAELAKLGKENPEFQAALEQQKERLAALYKLQQLIDSDADKADILAMWETFENLGITKPGSGETPASSAAPVVEKKERKRRGRTEVTIEGGVLTIKKEGTEQTFKVGDTVAFNKIGARGKDQGVIASISDGGQMIINLPNGKTRRANRTGTIARMGLELVSTGSPDAGEAAQPSQAAAVETPVEEPAEPVAEPQGEASTEQKEVKEEPPNAGETVFVKRRNKNRDAYFQQVVAVSIIELTENDKRIVVTDGDDTQIFHWPSDMIQTEAPPEDHIGGTELRDKYEPVRIGDHNIVRGDIVRFEDETRVHLLNVQTIDRVRKVLIGDPVSPDGKILNVGKRLVKIAEVPAEKIGVHKKATVNERNTRLSRSMSVESATEHRNRFTYDIGDTVYVPPTAADKRNGVTVVRKLTVADAVLLPKGPGKNKEVLVLSDGRKLMTYNVSNYPESKSKKKLAKEPDANIEVVDSLYAYDMHCTVEALSQMGIAQYDKVSLKTGVVMSQEGRPRKRVAFKKEGPFIATQVYGREVAITSLDGKFKRYVRLNQIAGKYEKPEPAETKVAVEPVETASTEPEPTATTTEPASVEPVTATTEPTVVSAEPTTASAPSVSVEPTEPVVEPTIDDAVEPTATSAEPTATEPTIEPAAVEPGEPTSAEPEPTPSEKTADILNSRGMNIGDTAQMKEEMYVEMAENKAKEVFVGKGEKVEILGIEEDGRVKILTREDVEEGLVDVNYLEKVVLGVTFKKSEEESLQGLRPLTLEDFAGNITVGNVFRDPKSLGTIIEILGVTDEGAVGIPNKLRVKIGDKEELFDRNTWAEIQNGLIPIEKEAPKKTPSSVGEPIVSHEYVTRGKAQLSDFSGAAIGRKFLDKISGREVTVVGLSPTERTKLVILDGEERKEIDVSVWRTMYADFQALEDGVDVSHVDMGDNSSRHTVSDATPSTEPTATADPALHPVSADLSATLDNIAASVEPVAPTPDTSAATPPPVPDAATAVDVTGEKAARSEKPKYESFEGEVKERAIFFLRDGDTVTRMLVRGVSAEGNDLILEDDDGNEHTYSAEAWAEHITNEDIVENEWADQTPESLVAFSGNLNPGKTVYRAFPPPTAALEVLGVRANGELLLAYADGGARISLTQTSWNEAFGRNDYVLDNPDIVYATPRVVGPPPTALRTPDVAAAQTSPDRAQTRVGGITVNPADLPPASAERVGVRMDYLGPGLMEKIVRYATPEKLHDAFIACSENRDVAKAKLMGLFDQLAPEEQNFLLLDYDVTGETSWQEFLKEWSTRHVEQVLNIAIAMVEQDLARAIRQDKHIKAELLKQEELEKSPFWAKLGRGIKNTWKRAMVGGSGAAGVGIGLAALGTSPVWATGAAVGAVAYGTHVLVKERKERKAEEREVHMWNLAYERVKEDFFATLQGNDQMNAERMMGLITASLTAPKGEKIADLHARALRVVETKLAQSAEVTERNRAAEFKLDRGLIGLNKEYVKGFAAEKAAVQKGVLERSLWAKFKKGLGRMGEVALGSITSATIVGAAEGGAALKFAARGGVNFAIGAGKGFLNFNHDQRRRVFATAQTVEREMMAAMQVGDGDIGEGAAQGFMARLDAVNIPQDAKQRMRAALKAGGVRATISSMAGEAFDGAKWVDEATGLNIVERLQSAVGIKTPDVPSVFDEMRSQMEQLSGGAQSAGNEPTVTADRAQNLGAIAEIKPEGTTTKTVDLPSPEVGAEPDFTLREIAAHIDVTPQKQVAEVTFFDKKIFVDDAGRRLAAEIDAGAPNVRGSEIRAMRRLLESYGITGNDAKAHVVRGLSELGIRLDGEGGEMRPFVLHDGAKIQLSFDTNGDPHFNIVAGEKHITQFEHLQRFTYGPGEDEKVMKVLNDFGIHQVEDFPPGVRDIHGYALEKMPLPKEIGTVEDVQMRRLHGKVDLFVKTDKGVWKLPGENLDDVLREISAARETGGEAEVVPQQELQRIAKGKGALLDQWPDDLGNRQGVARSSKDNLAYEYWIRPEGGGEHQVYIKTNTGTMIKAPLSELQGANVPTVTEGGQVAVAEAPIKELAANEPVTPPTTREPGLTEPPATPQRVRIGTNTPAPQNLPISGSNPFSAAEGVAATAPEQAAATPAVEPASPVQTPEPAPTPVTPAPEQAAPTPTTPTVEGGEAPKAEGSEAKPEAAAAPEQPEKRVETSADVHIGTKDGATANMLFHEMRQHITPENTTYLAMDGSEDYLAAQVRGMNQALANAEAAVVEMQKEQAANVISDTDITTMVNNALTAEGISQQARELLLFDAANDWNGNVLAAKEGSSLLKFKQAGRVVTYYDKDITFLPSGNINTIIAKRGDKQFEVLPQIVNGEVRFLQPTDRQELAGQ